jgi:hypothetical protein
MISEGSQGAWPGISAAAFALLSVHAMKTISPREKSLDKNLYFAAKRDLGSALLTQPPDQGMRQRSGRESRKNPISW